MTQNTIKRLPVNAAGRDIYVGDIHGCFARLTNGLKEIGFDGYRDRLICVGDLVDRGPQSGGSLEWLERPWFHAVKGNHEDMVCRFAEGRISIADALENGGAWYAAMPSWMERAPYVDAFEAMPIAIEVETPAGLIVVIHADVPGEDWGVARGLLEAGDPIATMRALWDRSRVEEGRESRFNIAGARMVIVGHTVVPSPVLAGNMLYLDTGACFGGAVTLFEPDHADGPTIYVERAGEPEVSDPASMADLAVAH